MPGSLPRDAWAGRADRPRVDNCAGRAACAGGAVGFVGRGAAGVDCGQRLLRQATSHTRTPPPRGCVLWSLTG